MLRIASDVGRAKITVPVFIQFGRLLNLKPHDINTDLTNKEPYTTLAELEEIRVKEDVRHNVMVLDGAKFIDLLKVKNRDKVVSYYSDLEQTANYIRDDLEKYMNGMQADDIVLEPTVKDTLISDIRNCTFYTRSFEDWNITHLANQYSLQSEDVFDALTKDAQPFGMGYFSHDGNKKSDFGERITNAKAKGDKYVHIDYWNGIGVKSSFPIDLENPETPLVLAIRRYNDRNSDTGYRRIFNMLFQNYKRRINDYQPSYPFINNLQQKEADTRPLYNPAWDALANAEIQVVKPSNKHSNEYWIWKYAMENHETNYYNHRKDNADVEVKQVWPFMMKPFYDMYIKDQPAEFTSLAYMFEFRANYIASNKIYNKALFNKLSIVNMLIYGKVNINMDILQRVLTLVRYTEDIQQDSVQLDNYEIRSYIYARMGEPRYEIRWRDDNIRQLKFAKTDAEKMVVCKALTRLMNEVPPELLNFNNYYHVCAWRQANELAVNNIDYLTSPDDS